MSNQLISRNVTVNGHRTSIRLERASWDALDDICSFEGIGVNELCTIIEALRHGSSRTSAVRSFSVTYFRMAATDDGHDQAGHGRMAGEMLEVGLPGRMAVTSLKRPDRIDLRRTVA